MFVTASCSARDIDEPMFVDMFIFALSQLMHLL